MIEFIIGSFLYAKHKGYKLKPIFNSWQIYLPLFFALFYVCLEVMIWHDNYLLVPYGKHIKTAILLSYIPLIYKFKLYQDEKGFILTSPMFKAGFCLGLGSLSNIIVMHFNNGFMPCYPSNSYWIGYTKPDFIQDGIHVLGNAYSHLIPLCNTIDVFYSIWSPGDLLCRMYVFFIIYYSIKNSNKIIK